MAIYGKKGNGRKKKNKMDRRMDIDGKKEG